MNITSADPFITIVFIIFNILLYIAVFVTPILILSMRKRVDKRLDDMEKELHKLNDLKYKN